MARQGDYLYRRADSANWRLKLQYPTEDARHWMSQILGREVRAVEDVSLRTPDRLAAEILAAPRILAHKRAMMVIRALNDHTKSHGRLVVRREMEPFTSVENADGSRTTATENEITHVFPDGKVTSRPNLPGVDIELVEGMLDPRTAQEERKRVMAKRAALADEVDNEIIENYVKRNRASDEDTALARTMAKLFREVTGKTFAKAGRTDAEALIHHLLTKGGKKGTGVTPSRVKRQIAVLKAAINLELREDRPRVSRNVFEHADIPDAEEAVGREAYSEAEMAVVRSHLHEFLPDECLLWVWHASTGIRPSEIHGIQFEDVEEAEDPDDLDPRTGLPRIYRTRYIGITRGKTDYSRRALPIPQAVLDLRDKAGMPLLPPVIDKPLFERSVERLCDAINTKLEKWGVNTEHNGKTFYCCRHRTARRLSDRGVRDEEVRRAILGHSRRIEPHDLYGRHRGYGHRVRMWRLKPDLDKIGY